MELKELIASVDLIEYIGQFVDLKESNGEYLALCPFHEENTPSLTLTPETQLFYCFGCGAGGNVISFIERYNNCSVREAINILKRFCNIDEDLHYVKNNLSIINTIRAYKEPSARHKKSEDRKILSEDIMQLYEADKDKLKTWYEEGISYEVMKRYCIKYDPLSNRIVFPIRDLDGNIVSVKGRTLDEDYKIKNIRKYTYYYKIGDLDFLFGYHEHLENIKNQKEVIVFEGEKSVFLTETWGIKNTLAICTSHLNFYQLQILIRLGVRVVFALDNNINIREDENIQKLKRFIKVEYVKDNHGILGEKDAPVDKSFEFWQTLYNERRTLN